ncbi:efflux RND transporter periplasmic adaptor subunit [Pyxidicoccus xibeiensis]|uniref:efflux RND transporter periplasmic adaptor subunit n=1 Tax=Pyxidicoccus xibeiensis TaxID=2906759 RepID=UPI0020A6FD25|nr:efflux RND transporter periplasmic adaptor subunit [Pyxidicoccus xibeiensis]MCP3140710.1 efflux RND transporter periplasmic adaptor subunit [Pyxidicoccus xibeiensis]
MRVVTQRRSCTGPWLALLVVLGACSRGGEGGRGDGGAGDGGDRAPAVDVKEVRRGRLNAPLTLVGTTQPRELVSVRARVEGHLESLTVDVGDVVRSGQELGRLDTSLLDSEVREAESGVAGARAEAASAEASVVQARSALEQARLALQQAEVEQERYARLAERGIASRQEAEQREITARTARQAVEAATQQVRAQESLAAAAGSRVQAQGALVSGAQQRRDFASLRSPLDGLVVARLHSAGDLVQPGGEVLRVGDFSSVEVAISVSELELSRVEPGKQVPVRLDAFPDKVFTGRIARVSPQADPVSRLVPVEVALENPDGRIGSGLLARVQLDDGGEERLLVLESALLVDKPRGPAGTRAPPGGADGGAGVEAGGQGRVFVVEAGDGGTPRVVAREVRVGARADGQVEVLSGLKEGDRVVVRGEKPLQSGMAVRPSALSDPAGPGPGGSRQDGGAAGDGGRGGGT